MSESAVKVGARNSTGDKKRVLDIRQKATEIQALSMELVPDEATAIEDVPAIPTLEAQTAKAEVTEDADAVIVDAAAKGDGLKVEESGSLNIYGLVRAVKSPDGEWMLDVLGVPFGGPNGGRDSDGEYFDAQTKNYEQQYGEIPAVYFHGFDENGKPTDEPPIIGTAKYSHTDAKGRWYRVVLNKANSYAQRIWESAKRGLARASSGSIAHMVRKTIGGYITHWPVVELSLIDAMGKRQPANQFAVALPVMKAVYARAGLTLPADIESIPQDKPEVVSRSAQGIVQADTTAKSKETTTDDNKKTNSKTGVLNMDPNDVQKLIDEMLKAREEASAAKAKAEAEIQTRIDAAVAAKTAELEAEAQKASASGAADRRIPGGAPNVRQFQNLDRFDNYETEDLAFAFGLLQSGRGVKSGWNGASDDLRKAIAVRILNTPTVEKDPYAASKTAMKMAGFGAMKANEVNQSTLANYGDEWVGVTYSTQLWDKIRLATPIAAKIPAIQVPDGSESIVIPVQSVSPTFYVVAQATDQAANPGRVTPTFTTSRLGTAKQTLTVNKLGAASVYAGELEEDSLLPWAQTLRADMVREGAEILESCIIDGDTAAGATTNINCIGGTPGGTEYYMLLNGFRKLALVTNTANRRDAGGALLITDYLNTVKLMGLGGRNAAERNKVSFIVDMHTNWKTYDLVQLLTRDVASQPVLEGGMVSSLYGYEVIVSANMHRANQDATYGLKANTAGKVDLTTPANNTTGAILAVRWDQWKLGYKRAMTFEVQRDAISDTSTLVMGMRVGLINRDSEASAISYNVLV